MSPPLRCHVTSPAVISLHDARPPARLPTRLPPMIVQSTRPLLVRRRGSRPRLAPRPQPVGGRVGGLAVLRPPARLRGPAPSAQPRVGSAPRCEGVGPGWALSPLRLQGVGGRGRAVCPGPMPMAWALGHWPAGVREWCCGNAEVQQAGVASCQRDARPHTPSHQCDQRIQSHPRPKP